MPQVYSCPKRDVDHIPVEYLDAALLCIEWYTCRWIIEEVFRILKKEGFNIEAGELGQGKSIRKLCLMILETIIKLFIMQIAYSSESRDYYLLDWP